jgi:hypothetical protein
MPISPCDGCNRIFNGLLKTINAKEWDNKVCNVSVEKSSFCSNYRCKFSLEGECCVEFQFCDDCLNGKTAVDKVFNKYSNRN